MVPETARDREEKGIKKANETLNNLLKDDMFCTSILGQL